MRIGINSLFLIPGKIGGTETYARGLIAGLEKTDRRNDYLIFCNQENYKTFNSGAKNFKKILCPIKASIRPLRILWEQLILPFYVWFQRIDILFSLGYVCPLFLPCKSVVVIYDLNWFFHPEEFSFFSRLAWKTLVTLSAKRADRIITSSENSKKDISKVLNIPKEKIYVVYGGVDKIRFRPILNRKAIDSIRIKYGIRKFILTVSAAYKFKNLGRLIDAFKIVNEKETNIQLLIVGLGGKGKPEIEEKIKSYHLEKKIMVAGWVPDKDLPFLYSAAEVYVHPSLYEGFGFPVLEAMSCGCPVISSNAASLPELVGQGGILVNAVNINGLALTIKKLLNDSSFFERLKRKGLEQSNLFTWRKSAEQVFNLINQQKSDKN